MKIQRDVFDNTVTCEFEDGRCIKIDARAAKEVGINQILRDQGYGHLIPTERVPVIQHGGKIGSVAGDFDPYAINSTSFFYDPRPGDFRRAEDGWVASETLGPGDLEAIPGFVWDLSQMSEQ